MFDKTQELDLLKRIAQSKKGVVLSKAYLNAHTKLKWECEFGHKWDAYPYSIKSGSWCKRCVAQQAADKKKHTIQDIQKFAQNYDGLCLSPTYSNLTGKLQWQCQKAHQWTATASSVLSGSWCPLCAGNTKDTLESMQALAQKKGGQCLSTEYINTKSHLEWECAKFHRWFATPGCIKKKSWCPVCAGKAKKNNEDIKTLITSRGGTWIDGTYSNRRTSLLQIRCDKGHEWHTTYSSLHKGRWCPKCGRNSTSLAQSIPDVEKRRLASARGGNWLGKDMETGKDIWQCQRKHHPWLARISQVKNGKTWCPYCKTSTGENLVRLHFEAIFDKKFLKAKPAWLISDQNTRLELDGYSAELRLAFEHNHYATHGIEHAFFSQKTSLAKRKKNDLLKLKICAQNKVTLIVIDGFYTRSNQLENLRNHIIETLKTHDINIPDSSTTIDINYNQIFVQNDYLKALQIKASEKEGWCLSTSCPYSDSICEFKCKAGHQWNAYASNLLNKNSWCSICNGNAKGDLAELQSIAEQKGGKCLAIEYGGRHLSHSFECKLKHVFKKTPDKLINRGQWCKKCAVLQSAEIRRQKTYERALLIAAEHNGRCLDNAYIGKNQKLGWECAKGHTWSTKISNIISKRWCPKCAKVARGTIDEMHLIAKVFGGVCLSITYSKTDEKILWQCKIGHKFNSLPGNVKRGHWCPRCKHTYSRAEIIQNRETIHTILS